MDMGVCDLSSAAVVNHHSLETKTLFSPEVSVPSPDISKTKSHLPLTLVVRPTHFETPTKAVETYASQECFTAINQWKVGLPVEEFKRLYPNKTYSSFPSQGRVTFTVPHFLPTK